ncbi:cell division protein FtsB [Aliikangiella marina]|uniref:Cell division protein FtsB n=1 Tax=Aliikangiella marina TaxID=1712262 RepID=A0A545T2Y3_9GAMM|nr:septum formation initiator family protein [Aliikangiella marina]TQV71581.1 cell division protein FtsB [Aliikangiella marina]
MKILGSIFAVLIIILQYRIWLGDNGAPEIEKLKQQIQQQQQENSALKEQNELLRKEIQALRKNPALLEEIAREQLGLIKPNETFYRIIPKEKE